MSGGMRYVMRKAERKGLSVDRLRLFDFVQSRKEGPAIRALRRIASSILVGLMYQFLIALVVVLLGAFLV